MQASLCYAYANFYTHSHALKVLTALDKQIFHQKPLRIHWLDKTRGGGEKLPDANVFIKNLPPEVDARRLEDCFCAFGKIVTCKVVTDIGGNSLCYGFVQFKSEAAAELAIAVMDQVRFKVRFSPFKIV